MKKSVRFVIVALTALALVGLIGCSSGGGATSSAAPAGGASGGTAGGNSVSIQNFSFNPASITVKAGDTVTWTNNDSTTHTVTGSGFDSGPLASGATFSHKFDTAGSFDYHCSIHKTMTGTVVVQ